MSRALNVHILKKLIQSHYIYLIKIGGEFMLESIPYQTPQRFLHGEDK